MGSATVAHALASPSGQQVMRSFWQTVSSIGDAASGRRADGGTKTDRTERSAMLLMVGMTPFMTAAQDVVDFGEALIREQGRLRKVKFFALGLPYSDVMFVKVSVHSRSKAITNITSE